MTLIMTLGVKKSLLPHESLNYNKTIEIAHEVYTHCWPDFKKANMEYF